MDQPLSIADKPFSTMNVNTNKKVSFYTQGQRFVAKVLLTVWLLASGSPEGVLADPNRRFGMVPATKNHVASPGPVGEGVTEYPISQYPAGDSSDATPSALEKLIKVEDVVGYLLSLFGKDQEKVALPSLLPELQVVHGWLCNATEKDVQYVMDALEGNAQVMASLQEWFRKGLEQVRQDTYDPTSPGGQLGLLIDSLQGFKSVLWQTPGLLNLLQQTAQDSNESLHVRAAAFYSLARVMSEIPDCSEDILDPIYQAPTIPHQSGEILEILKQAANDNCNVCHVLVEALGAAISAFSKELEAILQILIEATEHEYWSVRQTAIEALGGAISVVPDQSGKILETLSQAAENNKQWQVRMAAIEALGGAISVVPDQAAVIMPPLQKAAKQDIEWQVCMAAIEALGRIISSVPDQSGKILETLSQAANKDRQWQVRTAVVKALGGAISSVPDQSGEILETLSQAAKKDKQWQVRSAAVKALGGAISSVPHQSGEILETLSQAAKDKESNVRQAAIEALGGAISVVPDQSREILETLSQAAENNKQWHLRMAAIEALGGAISVVPAQSGKILKTLSQAANKDKKWKVRMAAIEALGGAISVVPDQSATIWYTLQRAAQDKNSKVKEEATKLLSGSLTDLTASSTNQLLAPQDNLLKPEANQNEQTSPTYKLGKMVWEQFYGSVDHEPSLPPNIEKIMSGSCPFWQGRTMQETHLLALIPTHVAGQPLTLDSLGELIKSPKKGGHGAQYNDHWGLAYVGATDIKTPDSSYWVLMTRDVLPDSRGKSYQQQCALVANHAHRTGLAYEIPSALEVTVVIALHHVRSGEALFHTYTRCCEENYDHEYHLAVGNLPSEGLNASNIHFYNFANSYCSPSVGVAACRSFEAIGKAQG